MNSLVGVDAAQLQDGVAHRRLDQHREVAAGVDRDHRLAHRHVEDVLVQRLVGQALELALHRLLAHQVHDQLQAHLPAHRGLAEDRLDVEQADAAHLEQVQQQLGAAAFERGLRDAVEVDRVVGHQAVAARDQLQPEFALAEARFAGEQHAEAEDVHEDAVARGALGEVLAEVAAHDVDHVAGRFARSRTAGCRRGRTSRPGGPAAPAPSATISTGGSSVTMREMRRSWSLRRWRRCR